MKGVSTLSTASAVLSMIGAAVAELPPIHVTGSKFFDESGKQFYIKGVAYQQEVGAGGATPQGNQKFVDPLGDPKTCLRDIPQMEALGMNTIRVYAIDPKKDHTECMQALDDAGIYVVADLSEPGNSINRDDPMWNVDIYKRYTDVIDVMQKYSNTLGFFAGNEVSNNVTNTNASSYVKAAVRDMKAYIKAKNYRKIPVGYATNDDAEIRANLASFFDCGKPEDAIDFWGYNIYSWCGASTYEKSGFKDRTEEFADYNVPAFFAEYGCNEVKPRQFTEVQALYSKPMTDVWSGGIVYMYFQEANQYGLVTVSGSSVTKLKDFGTLQTQLAKIKPQSISESSYSPTNTKARSCPAVGGEWKASSNLPPKPNADLCDCMQSSLSCVVKPTVNSTEYGPLFGYLCSKDGLGENGCDGISSDATTGAYGSYSMCTAEEKLSWAMNQFYTKNSNDPSTCNFDGQATTKTTSTSGSCGAQISQAGGAAGSVSSGTSSGGSSANSKSAAAGVIVPSFSFATLNMFFVLTVAFFGGVGMVMV